ncbi:hypothetical protein Dimus_021780 [Dionaea muscipula]
MASATTKPTFSFHLSTTISIPSTPQQKPHHLTLPLLPTKAHHQRPRPLLKTSNHHHLFSILIPKSIDVSKEDKPISEESKSEVPTSSSLDSSPNFDKRRLEEKFAVLNTGIYECRSCGYRYDEAAGDPAYPVPPGLPFAQLPDDWRCPTCGAAQGFFQSKSVEIAGFAENQQFGFGTNTLTSGQKALLIWGSLAVFFFLLLSGLDSIPSSSATTPSITTSRIFQKQFHADEPANSRWLAKA